MLPDLDFLVIETYDQLLAVLVALAFATWVGRLAWSRVRRVRPVTPVGVRAVVSPPRAVSRTTATDAHFDRLATLVARATEQAWSIAETQRTAARTLDSTEMALQRMRAELAGLTRPLVETSAGVFYMSRAERNTVPRPVMPLPDYAALAA